MRKVTVDIAKLGLSLEDEIKVELVNIVGETFATSDGYSYSETITLDSQILTLDLRENDTFHDTTSYKITTPKKFSFSFVLSSSLYPENKPCDLIGLLRIGCFEGIIDIKGDKAVLNNSFLVKLDLYFTGENPHFTNTEKALVDLYEYYADNLHGTDTTIDVVQMMDQYLATIGVN